MKNDASLLARYNGGQHVEVWHEIRKLGDLIRQPTYIASANAVAREMMRRVRINVEIIYDRLLKMDYQFEYPQEAFVPTDSSDRSLVIEIEKNLGYLPLSLETFYLEVGSVNFIQSWNQIVHYYRPERDSAPELLILGEEDPLVVEPLSRLSSEIKAGQSSLQFCFAPDEFHKANYSGGENYHVSLPNPSADFHIYGMYGVNEYFVDYLRATFQYGGFRGKMDTTRLEGGKKLRPTLQIIEKLSNNLLKF
jgi:hypothetical protein